MRILLVSDFVPPVRGGLELHVDALAQELDRRGHIVAIATLTANPTPAGPSIEYFHVANLAAHFIPHERPDRPFHQPLPDPSGRRALRAIVGEFRPDVVHAHSLLGLDIPGGVPVVYTVHDYGLICQLRTLQRYDGASCSGPRGNPCVRCGAASTGWARSLLVAPATTLGRRRLRVDAFIAVSTTVRRAVRPYLDGPIEVIPNFVGRQGVTGVAADLPRPYVLFAGDPGAHKGVPDLMEAWSARPRGGHTLVLLTTKEWDGPVPEGVHVTSRTPEQMPAAWAGASVAVVPSRWADPCPTVAMEALTAGVPVIATAVGGLPDLVRDGIDGLLVPPRDPAALDTALTRLLADADRRRTMGRAAAEGAERFGVESVAARIVDTYERLITPAHP